MHTKRGAIDSFLLELDAAILLTRVHTLLVLRSEATPLGSLPRIQIARRSCLLPCAGSEGVNILLFMFSHGHGQRRLDRSLLCCALRVPGPTMVLGNFIQTAPDAEHASKTKACRGECQ